MLEVPAAFLCGRIYHMVHDFVLYLFYDAFVHETYAYVHIKRS